MIPDERETFLARLAYRQQLNLSFWNDSPMPEPRTPEERRLYAAARTWRAKQLPPEVRPYLLRLYAALDRQTDHTGLRPKRMRLPPPSTPAEAKALCVFRTAVRRGFFRSAKARPRPTAGAREG